MDKMGNFANKVIAAFLAGAVLLFLGTHQALGQTTWTTTGTANIFATVDVSTGTPTANLSPSSGTPPAVINNDRLAFGNAGHTLTIADDNTANDMPGVSVTSLGTITTVTRGGGTLIFELQNSGTVLTVGNIGTTNSRVTAIYVWESGGGLEVGNIFAGTLTINREAELIAAYITVETLTNTGELTANGAITAGTLTNNGGALLIAVGAITAETLTNVGELEAFAIDAETLANSGALTASIITAETLTSSGTLLAFMIDAETLINSGSLLPQFFQ